MIGFRTFGQAVTLGVLLIPLALCTTWSRSTAHNRHRKIEKCRCTWSEMAILRQQEVRLPFPLSSGKQSKGRRLYEFHVPFVYRIMWLATNTVSNRGNFIWKSSSLILLSVIKDRNHEERYQGPEEHPSGRHRSLYGRDDDPGGDPGGYRKVLCAQLGSFDIWVQGTEGTLETPTVKAILKSFKFAK